MTAPTPHDIQAQIDALSEQHAAYLSDDQLERFWSLWSRSLDAALIYLEQVCQRPAGKTGPRLDYLKKADRGKLPQLAPWDPCIDCRTPMPRTNGLAARCPRCRLISDAKRNRRYRREDAA